MTTALASDRRSITPRINAGTDKRPLASTAVSALPLKRCSSSTDATSPPQTQGRPFAKARHRAPLRADSANGGAPSTIRAQWITGCGWLEKGFHAVHGDFMPKCGFYAVLRGIFDTMFFTCSWETYLWISQ